MAITRLQPKAARATAPGAAPNSDWIVPVSEERGFARYLSVVWGGKWIILIALLAALAGAGLYLARAQKVYRPTPSCSSLRCPHQPACKAWV